MTPSVNQNFMLKLLPSQMEKESAVLYVFHLFPNDSSFSDGQMQLSCTIRECFSHKLVWLMAVCRCQEAAMGHGVRRD